MGGEEFMNLAPQPRHLHELRFEKNQEISIVLENFPRNPVFVSNRSEALTMLNKLPPLSPSTNNK